MAELADVSFIPIQGSLRCSWFDLLLLHLDGYIIITCQGVAIPIRAVLRPVTGVKIGSRGQRPLFACGQQVKAQFTRSNPGQGQGSATS